MKCCFIADLHGYLPNDLKSCEVVFICGDISPLNIQSKPNKMRIWLESVFKPWCDKLDCDKVIFIAGNHDYMMNNTSFMYELFPKFEKTTYLFHENYIYTSRSSKEYSIFGTPYCKVFGNWSFMRNDEILEDLFEEIPENLDILISHDAPYGCSDICLEEMWWNTGEHIGNKPLMYAVLDKSPNLLVHGHLHSSNHCCEQLKNTKVYCCSILNEKYEPYYVPLYLNV